MSKVNFVWIGSLLGEVQAACLRSFLKHGFEVVLHSFQDIDDAPEGVTRFDAHQLMDEKEIFVHRRSSSYAICSDIYRLRILKNGLGLYCDCDIFCLKPFVIEDYMMGWDSDAIVNTAVLNLPQNSELLHKMLEGSENRSFVPSWIPARRRLMTHVRSKLFNEPTHRHLPWGVIGPLAITRFVEELDLLELVKPIDQYYPLSGGHLSLLHSQGLSLEDITTPRSQMLHLFNSNPGINDTVSNTPMAEILAA